jgi:hypothetical protein
LTVETTPRLKNNQSTTTTIKAIPTTTKINKPTYKLSNISN